MNTYQGLYNSTNISADSISADNAIFNNITLMGNIKTDLAPQKVVITNVNQELSTITYTSINSPNTIVLRDSSGNIIVGAITADDLHINNSIDVKKLEIIPNTDQEIFTIFDTGSNKIFTVNTSTKLIEINGSLIIDDLDINKLVITNGSKKLISTLTLPDNCIINNSEINDPTMVFTGNNDSVLMTNGSGQVYCSTTLPNNMFMSNATLTDPYISNPFIGFGVGQANKLLRTGASGNTITSLTLPDNCNGNDLTINTIVVNTGINSNLLPLSSKSLGQSGYRWTNIFGVNTNTTNLAVTNIQSDLVSDVDITRNLGSQSYRWKTFYSQNFTDNGNNITIYGANNGNKFQILDNTNVSCFNVNTLQGGRVWIGGSNQPYKFIIADQDGNSVFDLRTASNGRIAIGGLNTQAKFNINDQDAFRVNEKFIIKQTRKLTKD